MKYLTYNLAPVLAPNCKQHIVSPAEVREVCYSLPERCIIFILIYSGGGGHEVHETFGGGGEAVNVSEPLV
jgi:hypothetical protein